MTDALLVVNAGSSSIKFSVFAVAASELALVFRGHVSGIDTAPQFRVRDASDRQLVDDHWDRLPTGQGHSRAIERIAAWLRGEFGDDDILGIGHRVVHGGPDYDRAVLIDDAVVENLARLIPLAPLHQPHSLAGVFAARQARPDLRQVACFDTAFHRGHPKRADRFALPESLHDEGIRRYGFHGLSYEYIARRLEHVAPEIADGRVVVAHLGSGASMCALYQGRSVDSTMGFTAVDGLPMGTRCGSLDPGVVLYLIRQKGMTPDEVETLLYHDSGLWGISGVSSDMRVLLDSDAASAAEAVDYFVYRIGRELGALSAALGGLDGLVFTAGIGEQSPVIRARVCAQAAWLGIELDPTANHAGGPRISTPASRPSAWVIATDEERMIALHTVAVLNGAVLGDSENRGEALVP
jgi:acetate kinase